MVYQGYSPNLRGRGRGRGGGSFGPGQARGKGRGRGRDDRFNPYPRNMYDTHDEDQYRHGHGYTESNSGISPTNYDSGSHRELRHYDGKYKRNASRSKSRPCNPRRGYYDRDAVDGGDGHSFSSDYRSRGRGGAPARGRGRGRGGGSSFRGRGGGWGDRSRSREWSADRRRHPADEGADYGFSISADSNDFGHDNEYGDRGMGGGRRRSTGYNANDGGTDQRHSNPQGSRYYSHDDSRDSFGGGKHGPYSTHKSQHNLLPLDGDRQRHSLPSGRYGSQSEYFHGAQNRANSDHELMTTSRSGNDSDLGGASDAGRHKRDIPIAPRDKDVRRTVFMRTITESNIYSDVIKQWFSEFGEVADVCNLTGRSGICYVMFYDSRCAQSVLERAGGYISIGNANLTLQPSRHRPDAIGRNPNPDDYQGSVLLSIEGSHVLRGFAESDMKKFEEYGEVCDFYSYDGLQNEWIVEYYDVRAAHEAILACHGMPFLGGTMYTTAIWDGSVSRSAPRRTITTLGAARSPNELNDSDGSASLRDGRNRGGYAPEAVAAHVRSGNVAMPENDAEAGGSPEGTGQQHAPNSTSGGGGGGGMAANDRMDVLTKLTLDPSLLRKAQAAKEILQQHKGLLGLDLPMGWQTESSTENTPISTVATAVDASTKSDSILRKQPPLFNGHVYADSTRHNNEPLVSSLLLSGLPIQNGDAATSATTVTANAGLSAVPEHLLHKDATNMHTPSMSFSPSETLATLDTTEKQQRQQENEQEDQSDGISRLLGILAQVQQSAYGEVKK